MHDAIFSAAGTPLDITKLELMAKGLSLDIEKFKEDIDSEAASSAIEADRKLAEKLGVNSTPRFFLNGRLLDGGIRELKTRLQEEFLRHQTRL